ncbi:MAG: efflux RND transporter periplasmic adaptor subunit [Dehalococcoidales bacterium]
MKHWKITAIILLCLALAGSVACIPFRGGVGEEADTSQLVEVVRGDLSVIVSGSGNIAVSDEANLTFGSSGKVDEIYVEEGDEVSYGEVLAELDTSALELALTEAELAVKQAELAIKQAETGKVQAEADWKQADYNRRVLQRSLAESRLRKIAETELEAATLRLEVADLQLEAANSQLVAAEEAVDEAQKQLDEATLSTPFRGVVTSVDVIEGEAVSATTTIVHLIDIATMELTVALDEIDIPSVKPGQRTIIELDALPALNLEGRVSSIGPLPTVESGVVLYEVEIGFDVPWNSGLRFGMSATVDIIISERTDVLLVPDRATHQDSQGNPIVYVMVDEQIEERSVVIGMSDGYQTEIVSGLEEGEIVVGTMAEKQEESRSTRTGIPFH